jgi:hypothetical protein
MRAEVCVQRVVGAQLISLKRGVSKNLADACWQLGDFLEEYGACASRPWVYHVLVEQQTSGSGALTGLRILLLRLLPREQAR